MDVFLLSDENELVPLDVKARRHATGFSVSVFRPRALGSVSMQIERWTSLGDASDVHWRTISGSSTTCIFGQEDSSRIYDVDPPTGDRRIFSWLLSESCDVFGNIMKYKYKAGDLGGLESLSGDVQVLERDRSAAIIGRTKYLKSIHYRNTTPNRSISDWQLEPYHGPWLFQVILDDGDHDTSTSRIEPDEKWPARQDRFSVCTSGFEIR